MYSDGNCIEFIDSFQRYSHFNSLDPADPWTRDILSSSFLGDLWSSMNKGFFCHLGWACEKLAVGIVLLISFSETSVLVHSLFYEYLGTAKYGSIPCNPSTQK